MEINIYFDKNRIFKYNVSDISTYVCIFLTLIETRLNNFLCSGRCDDDDENECKKCCMYEAADSRTRNDDLDRSGYKTETRSNAFVVRWHQSAKFL